jgi:hypothetical protein
MDMLVLMWIVFTIVVAIVAQGWGRSGFCYFLLAFFLSPLVAAFILAMEGRTAENKAEQVLKLEAALSAKRAAAASR